MKKETEKLKWKKRRERYDKVTQYPLKYIKKVKWDILDKNHERLMNDFLENSWSTYDLTYRVYHKSFKMYYMAENALDIWQLLLEVVGIKSFEDFEVWAKDNDVNEENIREKRKEYWILKVRYVSRKLNLIGATSLLVDQVKSLKSLYFEMTKNGKPWLKDSLALVGQYHIARQTVECVFEMLKDWKQEKGMLFSDRRVLGEKEALAMETFYCFSIRYMKNKDEEEKMREYIRRINKGEKK